MIRCVAFLLAFPLLGGCLHVHVAPETDMRAQLVDHLARLRALESFAADSAGRLQALEQKALQPKIEENKK